MSYIKTSRGLLKYSQQLFNINSKEVDDCTMTLVLKSLYNRLEKIGINWGPIFSTLIGIVRNDGYLPWANNLCIYILKEDEERFKDELWGIIDDGFELIRYERRGIYYLCKSNQYIRVFVLRKISSDIRHSGGRDFIFEKYIQNTTKWSFRGMQLNVPSELDECLSFNYGNWMTPVKYRQSGMRSKISQYILDHLPSSLYYRWTIIQRRRDFNRFIQLCNVNHCELPSNVELTYQKQRKHKKVLTVGVYDLIHKGHVELFRRAKGLGDYLIVAVQDGEWVNKYKDSQLLNSTEDRCFMVKSIKYVDEVVVYTDVDESIKNIDFDVFVTGPDQTHQGFQRAMNWCEDNGREHVVLSRTEGVSSSELKLKIAEKRQSQISK